MHEDSSGRWQAYFHWLQLPTRDWTAWTEVGMVASNQRLLYLPWVVLAWNKNLIAAKHIKDHWGISRFHESSVDYGWVHQKWRQKLTEQLINIPNWMVKTFIWYPHFQARSSGSFCTFVNWINLKTNIDGFSVRRANIWYIYFHIIPPRQEALIPGVNQHERGTLSHGGWQLEKKRQTNVKSSAIAFGWYVGVVSGDSGDI